MREEDRVLDGALGLEILSASRYAHPWTKVIVLTGFGNSTVMDKTFQVGAAFHFEKPGSIGRP